MLLEHWEVTVVIKMVVKPNVGLEITKGVGKVVV